MIHANELRLGNLVTWNPGLVHPNNTLPPMQVEIASIMPDRITYVFPNIENRVEPFEDDVAQTGVRIKMLEELEPILLTAEILLNAGFEKKSGLLKAAHFEKCGLQLEEYGEHFKSPSINIQSGKTTSFAVKYFHQLQNLYFACTGDELEIKLHGQQA